jgi:hypothetical protein
VCIFGGCPQARLFSNICEKEVVEACIRRICPCQQERLDENDAHKIKSATEIGRQQSQRRDLLRQEKYGYSKGAKMRERLF